MQCRSPDERGTPFAPRTRVGAAPSLVAPVLAAIETCLDDECFGREEVGTPMPSGDSPYSSPGRLPGQVIYQSFPVPRAAEQRRRSA